MSATPNLWATVQRLIDKALAGYCPHRVGELYISMTDADPSKTWPGTSWKRITDCFLRAADNKHPAGSTGGAWDVIQKSEQVAPHTHIVANNVDGRGIKAKTYDGVVTNYGINKIATSDDYNITASANVGGQPMDITNKYTAVYMWRRTA